MFQNRTAKGLFVFSQLLVVTFFATQAASTIAAEHYVCSEHRFTLTIPDGWVQADTSKMEADFAVYVPDDEFQENVTILATEISVEAKEAFYDPNFPLFVQKNLKELLPNATMDRPKRTTIDGKSAWKLSAWWEAEGECHRINHWLVVHKHRLYAITWASKSTRTSPTQVTEMIKSIRLL
ncbi:hypothetical protein LOC68_00885 [Blastopirellula sp. JC732]|uniref:DUF1795 domain-containing protein n=1 Tax=Blastopirellula sediminis TaxID=2894196 RepID=A0A9X1MH93_9BACT|nr:PsbP-related protein [Blastopirellula sediminis]MCC9608259.1 hypothetical protein [Blastopirellula sediminis]MCC9626949.1 hypothetical protein [Blastopirellula sediminis]